MRPLLGKHGNSLDLRRLEQIVATWEAIDADSRQRRTREPAGGLAMLQGYVSAWWRGDRQLDDPDLRAFIRAYQRRALFVGKRRATAEFEAARAAVFANAA